MTVTLHAADAVLTAPSSGVLADGAVLTDGGRVVAIGRYEDLAAADPRARVRRWPGLLTPGLVMPGADALLEGTYFLDAREEAPPPPPLTEVQWGQSARRGTQRLLARGVVAVAGRFTVPAVRTAVARSGLTIVGPLSAAGFHGELVAGGPADFAVFATRDADAVLAGADGVACVATVIAGRLLHRRR
ncbi:imidazolonepropionase-like domain-containing protein [Streptomyces sp. NPDC090022]|uniref:imidazolonepropionase-like domain-containing protein n=1 Tax=Streptomyces sp. NPDC090022 TaxID=3365920 RepID=UPI00382C481A